METVSQWFLGGGGRWHATFSLDWMQKGKKGRKGECIVKRMTSSTPSLNFHGLVLLLLSHFIHLIIKPPTPDPTHPQTPIPNGWTFIISPSYPKWRPDFSDALKRLFLEIDINKVYYMSTKLVFQTLNWLYMDRFDVKNNFTDRPFSLYMTLILEW